MKCEKQCIRMVRAMDMANLHTGCNCVSIDSYVLSRQKERANHTIKFVFFPVSVKHKYHLALNKSLLMKRAVVCSTKLLEYKIENSL